MKTFIRPTNMATALINAALRSDNDRSLRDIIIKQALTDNPQQPLKTGYNRAEHDGMRISNKTLNSLAKL